MDLWVNRSEFAGGSVPWLAVGFLLSAESCFGDAQGLASRPAVDGAGGESPEGM
jgi:hypothetical protein